MGKAAQTRQMIIEKSAPVFNIKGIAGTHLSDLMEVTQLAKGGIYGNFTNKEAIVEEVFEYMIEKLIARIRTYTAVHKSASSKLHAILDFYEDYNVNSPVEGGCPILNFGVETDDTDPELNSKVKAATTRIINTIIRILELGISQKEFSESIDKESFAFKFFMTLEGAILLSKIQTSNKALQIAVATLRADIQQLTLS